tara:strand:+ start:2291 stop:2713 length:423 start_codon:yes stop_codon:yes gene_type:complete
MSEFIYGDNVLQAAPITPKQERLYETASRYAELSSELESIKETLNYYKEILCADLPEEPGEYTVDIADNKQVVVKKPEKWEWDKAKLSSLYPQNATPDCVSTSYTVARVKFEAAPEEVKSVLKQALTIKVGLPTIKVIEP